MIKSHWRLAYRTVKLAIKVTVSILIQTAKAKRYITDLSYRRKFINWEAR